MMERTQIFDLMGEFKLYGMRNVYDEVDVDQHQTAARAAANRRRPAPGGDRRKGVPSNIR